MKYNFDEIIPRKGTGSIKYDKMNVFFGTNDLQPLWVADMDFATPDFILKDIETRLSHPILGYTMRKPGFNQSFIDWMQKRHAWKIKQEWLDFSPGVVSALAVAILALTQENDKIIIQTPVYHPFFDVIEGNNRTLIDNPLKVNEKGHYQMDFELLENQIDQKTKMMIISNPHNPVGRVWTKKELLRLGNIAVKHNLIILSDDIHSDFVYDHHQYIPIAELSPEIAQQVITVTAPSKTFNVAGLSTSVVIIPNEQYRELFRKKMSTLHLFLGNIFGATAFESAYKNGEGWLDQLIDYLSNNLDFAVDYIQQHIPKIKVHKPEGTFLLWLDFSDTGLSHTQIKDKLINEAKIALNDGKTFGKNGEKYFRMNVGTPLANLAFALEKLKRHFS